MRLKPAPGSPCLDWGTPTSSKGKLGREFLLTWAAQRLDEPPTFLSCHSTFGRGTRSGSRGARVTVPRARGPRFCRPGINLSLTK
jgi:hypothetical protein